MNIYVETNFVLELAFVQEQHESCQQIITTCEAGGANLVLPAFCIAESYEMLIRRAKQRSEKARELQKELAELARSQPYKDETDALSGVTGLMIRSSEEEDQRLTLVLDRILSNAEIIPLDADILLKAARYRATYGLEPQDSMVYSSVMTRLVSGGAIESCFISRDRKDFKDPDIEESLEKRGCRMLFSFSDGYAYIQHRIGSNPIS